MLCVMFWGYNSLLVIASDQGERGNLFEYGLLRRLHLLAMTLLFYKGAQACSNHPCSDLFNSGDNVFSTRA